MPLRRPSGLTLSRAHQYTGVPMATGARGCRIGVDIGGTLTSLVWVEDASRGMTAVIGPDARLSVDASLAVLAEPA